MQSTSILQGGLSPERLRRLSKVLESYVERGEIAGIVALIHRHDEEAYVATIGWQDKEAQLPIKRDTIFRIASMTKPIIAVAALTLVEEGKLRLASVLRSKLVQESNTEGDYYYSCLQGRFQQWDEITRVKLAS